MRGLSIFLFTLSFFALRFAEGFDLTPKTKFEKDLNKSWARSRVSKTDFGNEAQLLARYARVRGEFFEVARMAIIEVPKKNFKLMDPDTAVHGMGYLMGYKKWEKRKISNGTYRYIGFNFDTESWMLVAWKETQDRFLFSSAFVEAELQTPIIYEVELLQRRLLGENSTKFSFYDFVDSLKIYFTKAQAEALNVTTTTRNFFGGEHEFNAMVKHLNAPKAEFDKTYKDLNDARSAVTAIQKFAGNPGDSYSISTESLTKMLQVKPSQLFPAKEVVAIMAGAATISNPYLLGGNLIASQMDLLVGWLHELATRKKYNEAQLKASKEAYDNYIKSAEGAAVGAHVKAGLARLKNALNKLGFTDEQISSGTGISERLVVYDRYLERLNREGGSPCAIERLERLIKDLRPFVVLEEKTLKNLQICQTISNMGDAIKHSLIDKRNARIVYRNAASSIRESIDNEAMERTNKIRNTIKNAAKDAEDGKKRAAAAFKRHSDQYQIRKRDRIHRCEEEAVKTEGGTFRKKTRSECLDEDPESEIGKAELTGLIKRFRETQETEENIKREKNMGEGTGEYDDTGSDVERHNALARFLLQLRIEECFEVGGYCRGIKPEEEEKLIFGRQKEKNVKAEIYKACPELSIPGDSN